MKVPEQYRFNSKSHPEYQTSPGDMFGVFIVPKSDGPIGRVLKIIANDGLETGWDHVSISLAEQPSKTPSWAEMCFVKSLFWEPQQCVVQFHPPDFDYVNIHEGVLHLWLSTREPFPMPPKICV